MPKPAISIQVAKAHLRVEHDLDDSQIELFAATAVDRTLQEIGMAGCLRQYQSVISQLGLRFEFPVASVAVEKDDGAGGWTALVATTDYQLTGDPESEQCLVISPAHRGGRFRVTWNAGWEDSKVPAWFTVACLFLIAHFYENRSSIVVGTGVTAIELPQGFEFLCKPHKWLRFA